MNRNIPSLSTSTSSRPGTDGALRLETIVKMLLAFRDRPADPVATARVYVETTADLPLDALTDACTRFAKGRVEDRNNAFAPSTAELYDLAQQIADRTARIHAPLQLPPPEPKSHEGVGELLEKLAADLRVSVAESRDKDRATVTADKEAQKRRAREQWARDVEAQGGDPNAGEIPVSPALERLVREREAG